MKKHKRIEITAFRRRILIGTKDLAANTDAEVQINAVDGEEPIDTRSLEGQQILLEAMRLLESGLNKREREMSDLDLQITEITT